MAYRKRDFEIRYERLIELHKKGGLSTAMIAERLGVSQDYVGKCIRRYNKESKHEKAK